MKKLTVFLIIISLFLAAKCWADALSVAQNKLKLDQQILLDEATIANAQADIQSARQEERSDKVIQDDSDAITVVQSAQDSLNLQR